VCIGNISTETLSFILLSQVLVLICRAAYDQGAYLVSKYKQLL